MNDYFDSEGEIFIKLYNKSGNTLKYWETWNTDKDTAIVHWGKIGTFGKDKYVKGSSTSDLKEKINTFIEKKISEGYNEIPLNEQFTLSITFKLQNWGTVEDLDRREELRKILTKHLGWTGNGRCDDGDIGEGEMTLYAVVVDPYLAVKTIAKEFKQKKIGEQHRYAIMQGETVVESDYKLKG